jgi:hypothetical protein
MYPCAILLLSAEFMPASESASMIAAELRSNPDDNEIAEKRPKQKHNKFNHGFAIGSHVVMILPACHWEMLPCLSFRILLRVTRPAPRLDVQLRRGRLIRDPIPDPSSNMSQGFVGNSLGLCGEDGQAVLSSCVCVFWCFA